MKTRLFWLAVPVLTLALSSGCRDKDEDTPNVDWGISDLPQIKKDGGGTVGDGTTTNEGGSGACVDATVAQISAGTVKEKACVNLKDVVVIAVDAYGTYTGDLYVQDPSGSKKTGIKLYNNKRADGKKVTELKVGDHIKVKGTVKYYAPTGGFYGTKKYVLELEKNVITFISAGASPAPNTATAKYVTDSTTGADYDHMLVTVKNAAVVKIKPPHVKYKTVDVVVRDATGTIEIRDDLFSLSTLKMYGCYSFTGVSSYFFDWRVMPRSATDLAAGTGCPKPTDLSISDLQNSASTKHPKVNDWVKVTGVVTAIDANPYTSGTTKEYTGFYIQDEKGGQYSGIYVYYKWKSTSTAAEIPVLNDKMELAGTYIEYPTSGATVTLSELSNVNWVSKGKVTVAPTPSVVTAADIGAAGKDGAKWEGVLVTVKTVVADSLLTDSKSKTIGFTNTTSKLKVVNTLYDFTASVTKGTTYKSVTGIVTVYKNEYQLLPRSAADLVK